MAEDKDVLTRKQAAEAPQMTLKQPGPASAMMAPMTGAREPKPPTMLLIWVASILGMLNCSMRYTVRFDDSPNAATPTATLAPTAN